MHELPTIVTAFYNLERWTKSDKTARYIDNFKFLSRLENEIVAFVEEDTLKKISPIYKNRENISFCSISEETLFNDVIGFSFLDKFKSINKDPFYREFCGKRPCGGESIEVTKPEYNCFMHSKVDFVRIANHNGLIRGDWAAWADFGLIRNENCLPSDYKFQPYCLMDDPDRVNFIGDPKAQERWHRRDSWWYYLIHFWEITMGGMFFLNKKMIDIFALIYFKQINNMVEDGVMDDDQVIYHRLCLMAPQIFSTFNFDPECDVLNSLKLKHHDKINLLSYNKLNYE